MNVRCCGAPAWLNVYLTNEVGNFKFDTLWRDGLSQAVNAKYVRLNEGMTMSRAIKMAVMNWDRWEKNRVERYNTDLIVALAQSRIDRWGKAGQPKALYRMAKGGQLRKPLF